MGVSSCHSDLRFSQSHETMPNGGMSASGAQSSVKHGIAMLDSVMLYVGGQGGKTPGCGIGCWIRCDWTTWPRARRARAGAGAATGAQRAASAQSAQRRRESGGEARAMAVLGDSPSRDLQAF
jgi:hypothetical protein